MKQSVYSIYDRVALSYGNPMIGLNDEVMRRDVKEAFSSLLQSKKHFDVSDFSLVLIGEFDTDAGVLYPLPHRKLSDISSLIGGVSDVQNTVDSPNE